MTSPSDEKSFERRWLHKSTVEHKRSVISDIAEVKEYAYHSFDHLDRDSNGYIALSELHEWLEQGQLDNREESFVRFLLNNHTQIACFSQGDQQHCMGISRTDIEHYFDLIAKLMAVD